MFSTTWIDTFRLRGRVSMSKSGSVAYSRLGIGFANLSKATVRYRVSGSPSIKNPTIVMVCDPPNVIEHFDEVIELLSAKAQVVCFEPPGFGFSVPRPGFGFGFQDYVSCVNELLDTLKLGPYLLAFPCIWAHIALHIASQRPVVVTKLMLWQCPSWQDQVKWAKFVDNHNILSLPFFGQAVMSFIPKKVGTFWYRAALSKGRYTDFLPIFEQSLKNGAFCCLGSVWQEWFSRGEPPSGGQIIQPSLVAWGLADRTHRHSDRLSLGDRLNHVLWHEFKNSGHSPELEAPQQFAELLNDWISN